MFGTKLTYEAWKKNPLIIFECDLWDLFDPSINRILLESRDSFSKEAGAYPFFTKIYTKEKNRDESKIM